MSSQYFVDNLGSALGSSPAIGDTIRIEGDEAKHMILVDKRAVGDRVFVGDGRGTRLDARVIHMTKNEVELRSESVRFVEKAHPEFVLVQALAKAGRDELAVQTATEIGVDGIIPWQAMRSIVKWDDDKKLKGRQRWSKIAREASKQSLRSWIPLVHEIATLKTLVTLTESMRVLILDPHAPLFLSDIPKSSLNTALVVGPEGGITQQELDALIHEGAQAVRIGSTVLRTSSAGPVALSLLNTTHGRWNTEQ